MTFLVQAMSLNQNLSMNNILSRPTITRKMRKDYQDHQEEIK